MSTSNQTNTNHTDSQHQNTHSQTQSPSKPSAKAALVHFRWRNPFHLLAFGFGSGLSPKMPGTIGTLAAIPFYLLLVQCPFWIYLLVTVVGLVAGCYICGKTAEDLQVHDHGGIVWDEFVGFWITMMFAPVNLVSVVLGFVLFRLFDIWKPWPIRWCDRQVGGGLGIMLDDVIAGVMAAMALMAILSLIAWVS